MELKICGLSKILEVETCVAYNVNYCGFILNYPKSHRYISFEQARALTNIHREDTKYVGVLVKPSEKELETFSQLNFDYFQLYGNYSDAKIFEIKKKTKKKIIASIQVEKKKDVQNFKNVEKAADIILWDSSGYEESLSWDFQWIKTILTSKKKMIAGNITIEKLSDLTNIADIIDVSGALETNKVKDIEKIKKFITKIKHINNEN